jgi:hypothetical protein
MFDTAPVIADGHVILMVTEFLLALKIIKK